MLRCRGSMEAERRPFVSPAEDDDPDRVDEQIDSGFDDAIHSRANEATIRDAIRQLPPKMGRVAWLCWVERLKQSSNDADEITVSKVMQMSDSMIRRYLRQAVAMLEKDPVIQAIRDDVGHR